MRSSISNGLTNQEELTLTYKRISTLFTALIALSTAVFKLTTITTYWQYDFESKNRCYRHTH